MTAFWRAATAAGLLAALAACSGGGASLTPEGAGSERTAGNIARALPLESPSPAPSPSPSGLNAIDAACALVKGHHCHTEKNGAFSANANPNATSIAGLQPADLRGAYGLPAPTTGAAANGRLIAIVDAYDDPYAESDLAVYRARFELPACTTANGCFSKYALKGKSFALLPILAKLPPLNPKPSPNANWGDETALDLAMASVACPTCRIALFEAPDSDLASLAAAVNAAAALHPAAISNSYGVMEAGLTIVPAGSPPPGGKDAAQTITADQVSAYDHPGIAVVASTGDSGVVEFPASSPNVIAVGGTSLAADASNARGWSETAWRASGRGCSALFAAPAWQPTALTGCATRAVADVSFAADLNPGVAVYSSEDGGWLVLGGTSVGAPFVAGLVAAAGDYGSTTVGGKTLWAGADALNPVKSYGTGFATLGSPAGLAGF